jgi:hypothetical protein
VRVKRAATQVRIRLLGKLGRLRPRALSEQPGMTKPGLVWMAVDSRDM